jgi:peptidoglycan-N-acetylmuramic acid deacetylase
VNTPTPPRNTSAPLILLTLVAGVALGWLLRDTFTGTPQAIAPTATPAPATATAPPAPPTSVPSAPTASVAPSPTLIPAPTYTPEPPTATPAPPAPEPPTATPAPPAPEPSATPAPPAAEPAPEIAGYAGHVVAEGETLETIAERGGSTPDLIARYNLLEGPPQPGRGLIVPQLGGRTADLESTPILVQRGSNSRPWVALTLDAGASAAPVPRMLQTLRERGVTITFFLTGAWIAENPELASQIVADGHEIANHTRSHPDLRHLNDDSIRQELADTEALMQQIAGASTRPFFRPPFGAYDERVLRIVEAEGYLPIYWTLDSLDSVGEPKTPEFLLERVTGKLTPEQLRGAIILAHCGSEPTADALPRILDRFAEMGFEVKKVSEVLADGV